MNKAFWSIKENRYLYIKNKYQRSIEIINITIFNQIILIGKEKRCHKLSITRKKECDILWAEYNLIYRKNIKLIDSLESTDYYKILFDIRDKCSRIRYNKINYRDLIKLFNVTDTVSVIKPLFDNFKVQKLMYNNESDRFHVYKLYTTILLTWAELRYVILQYDISDDIKNIIMAYYEDIDTSYEYMENELICDFYHQ